MSTVSGIASESSEKNISASFTPLGKAITIVRKYKLLPLPEIDSVVAILEHALIAKQSFVDIDKLTEDAPDEFIDPLMSTIMRDPVLLPTSGNIVDRYLNPFVN